MNATESPERRINQLDLARAAGVSVSTVSRALSDAPGISDELRTQIHHLARKLGYGVRSERVALPRVAAYLALNSATGGMGPFYESILDGLMAEARSAGMEVETAMVEGSALGPDRIAADVRRLDSRAAFLIGVDPPEETLRLLDETRAPIVFVNGLDPLMRFDCVVPSNFYGASAAARVLLDAGHRSILYVTGQHRTTTRQRLLGFETAIQKAGARGFICEIGRVEHKEIVAALEQHFTGRIPEWTGIVCMNDLIAVSVKQFLDSRNLRVPEDISLVGFDDLPYARMIHPRLSTVRVDRDEIGAQAVRLMQRRLGQPDATPLQIEVGIKPVPGSTVRTISVS